MFNTFGIKMPMCLLYFRCPFKLRVVIKKVTVDKVKKDAKVRNYPCFITIQGQHNHSLHSTNARQQLRVLPSTRASLENLFQQGWWLVLCTVYSCYNYEGFCFGTCICSSVKILGQHGLVPTSI